MRKGREKVLFVRKLLLVRFDMARGDLSSSIGDGLHEVCRLLREPIFVRFELRQLRAIVMRAMNIINEPNFLHIETKAIVLPLLHSHDSRDVAGQGSESDGEAHHRK